MNDEEVQELIRSDPEKGYPLLIKQYANYVYVIAANRLKNICTNEDIEECVSDVFYDLYLRITTFEKPIENLKGLIGTIAKRRSIDIYRNICNTATESNSIEECISDRDVVSETDAKETHIQLINAISLLSEQNRVIVYRYFFLGQKTGEIARVVGLKPAAVTKRLKRSVEKLKHEVKENDFYV